MFRKLMICLVVALCVQTVVPLRAQVSVPQQKLEIPVSSEMDTRYEYQPLLSDLLGSPSDKMRQSRALKALRERAPQAQVVWSLSTGGARHVFAYSRALTEPVSTTEPVQVARNFLQANPLLFNLTEAQATLDTCRLIQNYRTPDTGITHLTFQQYFQDIPVLGGTVRAHVLPNGSLLSVSGDLYPVPVLAAAIQKAPNLNQEDAQQVACSAVGVTNTGELREPIQTKSVLYPLARGVVRQAWQISILPLHSVDCWRVLVDAERGEVLKKYNLTWYASQDSNICLAPLADGPQGRVFTLTPQPNLPRVSQMPPQLVDRQMRSMGGDPTASPTGWVDLTRKTTVGNNVIAQEDRQAKDDQSGFRPTSETLTFDFPLVLGNPAQGPELFQAAAVTNVFYWANFMHDYLYALGFDEAAGNFQQDNFGRGGIGGDPVITDAQDGARTNNSSFSTSEDGFPSRMSMFFWTKATPLIDGDYDAEIILHEYTHGLTNRLVGGPMDVTALNALQSSGMGEGWSDWFALSILTRPEDDLNAAFPFGSYVSQNFDHGLRRFPYSTDLQVCPVTFADIDPAQTRYPVDPTEIHKIGEIWCAALWDVRANFITQYGFQEGKTRMERLVVEALKLTPTNPSMLDGRDALLLADQVTNHGANQSLIWKGFAKRGMGFSAQSLSGGLTSVKQAFDLPSYVDTVGKITLNDVLFADGETMQIKLGKSSLVQMGTAKVSVHSASGDAETVTLKESASIPALFEGSITVRVGQMTVQGDGVLQARIGDDLTVTQVTSTDTPLVTKGRAGKRVILLEDNLEPGSDHWKPKGSWALTTRFSHSPTHAWTDSPAGDYPPKANLILMAPSFDLSKTIGAKLTFWQRFDIERAFDFGLVEVRTGAGQPWQTIAAFSGTQSEFMPITLDLSSFDGTRKLKVRFRLISDAFNQRDGWYLDDLQVTGGSTQ